MVTYQRSASSVDLAGSHLALPSNSVILTFMDSICCHLDVYERFFFVKLPSYSEHFDSDIYEFVISYHKFNHCKSKFSFDKMIPYFDPLLPLPFRLKLSSF